jgi:hypothetical protein
VANEMDRAHGSDGGGRIPCTGRAARAALSEDSTPRNIVAA